MMTTLQAQGGASAAPPPPPPTTSDLGREIQQAVREAIQASTQGATGAEQARAAGERARAAAEELRAQLEAARQQGQTRTVVTVPPIPQDIIPPQAVDISIAFFLSVVAIVVGLPIARAFARRMDRKSQSSGAATELAPRLDRIEQAIEAIAIEVERVSENQRYSTRIISELRGLPAPNPLESWPPAERTVPEPALRSAPDERRP